MEQNNIIENNVLIAKFMKWKKDGAYGWLRPGEKEHWDSEYRSDDYLYFDDSWNELMSTIHKINDIYTKMDADDERKFCIYVEKIWMNLRYVDIKKTYQQIIDFIKLYNKL